MVVVQKSKRAYLRSVPGYPIEAQRLMAERDGCDVTYEYGEGAPIVVRDAYVNSLREQDTAWVIRLDVLVLPKRDRGRIRSTTDLAVQIAAILGNRAVIVEHVSGVSSTHGKAWKARVKWANRYVSQGRLSPAKAKRNGAKGGAKRRATAIATLWLSDAMKDERARWGAVWRDPKYSSSDTAADALPAPIAGRKWLARRIFGPRIVAKRQRLGRPPKRR